MSEKQRELWINILPEDVEKMLEDKGNFQLIDVREVDEYKAGHIKGAVLIPLSQLDVRHFEIDRDKETVVVCRSGGRSTKACEYLSSRGHSRLKNMTGGMLNWKGETE
ncbi:rhodanese-like domain-containing protein [Aneurinibacillus sp. Ricciae_BoGa-3]|uniref:rhodanese-like domain-containing protein n=1 Tax=Aneurinibacillus sp. Ricciae_BoGa-3 TaxID=3022697 RepID=UPI0023423709|nr:rhodanese-like domain-containing protein [Aneurinibacillus sp. Ricciae_BoGa-3]WCK53902.1 rhodanese-like domain-containing protein [Aneurinibacillus sp. Ricciae_BoGa-3]